MAWPKGVPRKPKEPETPIKEGESVPLPDAAISVYRDRSGPRRDVKLSEGKANFGAITEAARAIVKENGAA